MHCTYYQHARNTAFRVGDLFADHDVTLGAVSFREGRVTMMPSSTTCKFRDFTAIHHSIHPRRFLDIICDISMRQQIWNMGVMDTATYILLLKCHPAEEYEDENMWMERYDCYQDL